jgi:hypothetical protein
MAEPVNPQALAQQIYFLQNPQAGLQYQQQQMLAQQMMQQGSQYPDTHAMVGNVVAPVSPVADASKALQQMLGAYMMNKSNQAYGNAMSPQGQSNGQPVGQGVAIGNMMNGNPAAPVTGNVAQDAMQNAINNEAYKAAVANHYAALNKAAEVSQTPQNFNGHIGFITPPGMRGGQQPQTPMTAAPQPASPSGNPTQLQATGSNVLPNGQPDDGMGGILNAASAQAKPIVPAQAPVDFNNPVAVAGAKTSAEDTGKNLADTTKTFNVAAASLPRALQRFDQLRQAAPDASSGYGVDENGEGHAIDFAKSAAGQIALPKTATANQIIQQASKQGILSELGPQLAGLRGNKFLESIASGASGLNASDPPATKINAINGLQTQYIANLKSLAAQRRSYGDTTVPTDDQIDGMVAKAAPIPLSAIAHLKANPALASQFEQKYAVPSKPFLGDQ